MNKISILSLFLMIALGFSTRCFATPWEFDLESGYANSGYNVVRIPGDVGTQVSLSDELTFSPSFYWRLKVYYDFNEEHALGILYAPLSLHAEGEVPFPIVFADSIIPANTPIKALYKFNSYRLTYRYRFLKTETIKAYLGFTAKIRDAEISLETSAEKAQKTNVGFVPIIYFKLAWEFAQPWSLIFDGDALAAPQGRAEDIMLALNYQADEHTQVRIGYRMLEGGAGNKEVYNFALIHYALVGVTFTY